MRATKVEIEETLKKMERKHKLRKGVLSEIYDEEARVVFLGRRRNIFKNIRRIVKDGLAGREEN